MWTPAEPLNLTSNSDPALQALATLLDGIKHRQNHKGADLHSTTSVSHMFGYYQKTTIIAQKFGHLPFIIDLKHHHFISIYSVFFFIKAYLPKLYLNIKLFS